MSSVSSKSKGISSSILRDIMHAKTTNSMNKEQFLDDIFKTRQTTSLLDKFIKKEKDIMKRNDNYILELENSIKRDFNYSDVKIKKDIKKLIKLDDKVTEKKRYILILELLRKILDGKDKLPSMSPYPSTPKSPSMNLNKESSNYSHTSVSNNPRIPNHRRRISNNSLSDNSVYPNSSYSTHISNSKSTRGSR